MNFAPFLDPTECHGADSHSWHPSRSVFGDCPNSLNSGFRVELVTVVLLWPHPSHMVPIVHGNPGWLCTFATSSFPVFWMNCLFQEFSAAFPGSYSAVGMLSRTPSEMWDVLISSTLFLVSGCSGCLPSSSFCISWHLSYPTPQLNF